MELADVDPADITPMDAFARPAPTLGPIVEERTDPVPSSSASFRDRRDERREDGRHQSGDDAGRSRRSGHYEIDRGSRSVKSRARARDGHFRSSASDRGKDSRRW